MTKDETCKDTEKLNTCKGTVYCFMGPTLKALKKLNKIRKGLQKSFFSTYLFDIYLTRPKGIKANYLLFCTSSLHSLL